MLVMARMCTIFNRMAPAPLTECRTKHKILQNPCPRTPCRIFFCHFLWHIPIATKNLNLPTFGMFLKRVMDWTTRNAAKFKKKKNGSKTLLIFWKIFTHPSIFWPVRSVAAVLALRRDALWQSVPCQHQRWHHKEWEKWRRHYRFQCHLVNCSHRKTPVMF